MGDFFKPWRRKFGVLTLLMACVLTGGWVRGSGIKDVFNFGSGDGNVIHTLVSSHHGLMWIRAERTGGLVWKPGWFTESIDASTVLYSGESMIVGDIKWRWKWCGFDFCDESNGIDYESSHRNIPYWSIVIPLTVISLWLLVSKPRKSTSDKISETVQVEGD